MDASEAQSDPDRAGAEKDRPAGAELREEGQKEAKKRPRRRRDRDEPREQFDGVEQEPPPLPSGAGLPEPAIVPVEVPGEHVDEDALKVIRRLRRYGHHAYLVGG